MAKRAVSVTLEADNLLWLHGRATSGKRRSLSDALDEVVTAARTGGHIVDARSVVGTVDIGADDPGLEHADAYVRALYDTSVSRPFLARESASAFGAKTRKPRAPRRG